jgi:peptidoglycan/LPS O-acetylase OafA/YrhL
VPGFRRLGDYSYGIYVYAYPTQQAIASVLGPMPPLLLFGLAYPAIFALAFASWHAIERPALRFRTLKPQGL